MAGQNQELREQNERLRLKLHNQRKELRRLNAAHLRKNARIDNLELDGLALEQILAVAGIKITMLPSASILGTAHGVASSPLAALAANTLQGSPLPSAYDDDIPF